MGLFTKTITLTGGWDGYELPADARSLAISCEDITELSEVDAGAGDSFKMPAGTIISINIPTIRGKFLHFKGTAAKKVWLLMHLGLGD